MLTIGPIFTDPLSLESHHLEIDLSPWHPEWLVRMGPDVIHLADYLACWPERRPEVVRVIGEVMGR